MIDVSNLSHLQAEIVLLIERRGETGIRVCELCKEINGNEGNIRRNLASVLRNGFVIRVVGDVPRYYVSAGAQAHPISAQAHPVSAPTLESIGKQIDEYSTDRLQTLNITVEHPPDKK